MELNELFAVQKILNERIIKEHNLDPKTLSNKKFLALLTELGELANETRCFKYWSTKDPSPRQEILEEYVDCLHFILTLGLDQNFEAVKPTYQTQSLDLTTHFIHLFHAVNTLYSASSMMAYTTLFNAFFALGAELGFTQDEVLSAYMEKNKINHQRQDAHY